MSPRSAGDHRAAAPTRAARKDPQWRPAQMALAARWMLQSRQSPPAQHNLLGQSCCQIPRWEPGQGRGSSEPAQARACQPQHVPDHRSWAERQDPGARTCRATKPPGSPHPAAFGGLSRYSPTPLVFSRSARAEVGSPLSSHDRARCTSEQSPRPDVSARTGMRTRPARPPGPCSPRPASTGA